MRFQVPQFIEVEDKIFGPLTFKQFVYVGGGVGAGVVFFTFLPNFIAFLFALPVFIFSLALAFYKPNQKPFIYTVEAFIKYTLGGKLYLWHKMPADNKQRTINNGNAKPIEQVQLPKLSESRLKQLTWELDIRENSNPVTEENPKS